MIFYCQRCGEQHTLPHVAAANITHCAKCGGQSFATWKPAAPTDTVPAERGWDVKFCTGCGRREGIPLPATALACCPDNRYRSGRQIIDELAACREEQKIEREAALSWWKAASPYATPQALREALSRLASHTEREGAEPNVVVPANIMDLHRLEGMFVGQLDRDELLVFERAVEEGRAYREFKGVAGLMGLAVVRLVYVPK